MIYFLQPTSGGPVKIGYSQDVPARLKQLEAHYGKPLALLATLPGGQDEEREIHARFAEVRLGKTEQFRPVAELMEFIGRPLLVGPNPDAVEPLPVSSNRILTRFVMVATEDYLDWLGRFADHLRRPEVSDAVREVLRQAAEREGFEQPPAR